MQNVSSDLGQQCLFTGISMPHSAVDSASDSQAEIPSVLSFLLPLIQVHLSVTGESMFTKHCV